jgi:integrase
LPYDQTSAFIQALRQQEGIASLALEFTILTAARTGEVLGACWNEIDLNEKIWTVPASRMKGGREHRCPLSRAAMEVLSRLGQREREQLLFMGRNKGPLSGMALLMLIRRMKFKNVTVHGFRSTFRDWAAERTNFQREVAEAALAHVVGDKVEAAYRRSDLFEKRRRLMEAWGEFATVRETPSVVVKLSANN